MREEIAKKGKFLWNDKKHSLSRGQLFPHYSPLRSAVHGDLTPYIWFSDLSSGPLSPMELSATHELSPT